MKLQKLLVSICVAGFAASADAALFNYSFTGSVYSISSPLTGAGIGVGTSVSGSFTLNTAIADTSPGSSTTGFFPGISGSVNIGGSYVAIFTGTALYLSNSSIDVFSVYNGSGTVSAPTLNGISLAVPNQSLIYLQDNSGVALSSDQMTALSHPINLTAWPYTQGTLSFVGGSTLNYRITSLTNTNAPVAAPAPGALALLGLGLFGLGATRRRKAA